MTMPQQKPGKSKQDYSTPIELLRAAKYLIGGEFVWDLAATMQNKVVDGPWFYGEEDDALTKTWNLKGWCWCNPPFENIKPWVHKAFLESTNWGAHVCMLVPASVGANWWRDWVHEKAQVILLNGRITFVGMETPYPKDCALLLYRPTLRGGYSMFNWQEIG
jgi:phage N-6-adenine-methyltransferase